MQPVSEQQPNSLDGALDGGVINHLLSMKSADIALLLQSIESQNEPGDATNAAAASTVPTTTSTPAASAFTTDAQRPMLEMIDRKNSSSFAKLFSMKNVDFKDLLVPILY